MSDERSNVEQNTKSEMENSTIDQSQSRNAAIGSPYDQALPPILKLNIDCFEELFEWLSLADLRSLRQACKRLNQVVDFFIKTNYPAVRFNFGTFKFNLENLQKFLQLDPIEVKMIKCVEVDYSISTKKQVAVLKAILPQIEELNFHPSSKYEANFYVTILQWCTNLKRLCIFTSLDRFNGGNKAWLKHSYPTIEYFKLYNNEGYQYPCSALRTFFELNPNIKTFSCTFKLLYRMKESFFGSKIKIHRFIVRGHCDYDGVHMTEVRRILDQLYEQGFYQRIHLYIYGFSEQYDLNQITSTHGLDKLHIRLLPMELHPALFPPMSALQEFCTWYSLQHDDCKSAPKNLMNIERLYFGRCELTHIIPFIRYAARLKEIKIDYLYEWTKDSGRGSVSMLDSSQLSALNKEREKLAGACKVTIYVSEALFLSTKFSVEKIDYSLITLKRAQATKWTYDFYAD